MRRAYSRALVLLGLTLLLVSGADPQEFDRYLQSANRLINSLEFEKALLQLESARKHSRGLRDDVTLELLEGVLLVELGRVEDGRRAFRAAFGLDPDATVPILVAPKVRRELEAVRAEMRAVSAGPPLTSPPTVTPPDRAPALTATAPSARVSSRPFAWSLLGAAVVSGATSAGLKVHSHQLAVSASHAFYDLDARPLASRADGFATASLVTSLAAGALLVAALVLFFMGS